MYNIQLDFLFSRAFHNFSSQNPYEKVIGGSLAGPTQVLTPAHSLGFAGRPYRNSKSAVQLISSIIINYIDITLCSLFNVLCLFQLLDRAMLSLLLWRLFLSTIGTRE